ncbi:MAG: hypothetical protein HDT20_06050 [Oscillibacter sp.]|nr:hypothetical protein [Oscillibacter sp.]
MDNYIAEDHLLTLPLTIEAQLERYSRSNNDRYELLWHAWKQNKRWLSKLLELAFPSFPGYSQHDASHAETVLHNIERVLGEQRIRCLSASDCFMLLHTAYIHDIGMCITAEDRDTIIRQDGFNAMLDRFARSNDSSIREWAGILQRTRYEEIPGPDDTRRKKALKELYQEKLKIYYAIMYTMAEYQRENHGERSRERLEDLVERPEKLGGGFSMSGIPMRIFLSIAACGGLHTSWGFTPILELPKEDSGYALDKIHPRFVAVMLQLGDALDLDNDRFHPLMLEYVGSLNSASQNHYDKHKAIRCLQITPSEIFIAADCSSQAVLHLVRQSCDSIELLLKEASYHWSEIVPGELYGCLPTMVPPKLRINDQEIPKELVTCRFAISQEKAFQLLEGSNLYSNSFVFLREIIQNAIDATKMQCFYDYRCSNPRYGKLSTQDEIDFVNMLQPERYPIEVQLRVVAASPDKQDRKFYASREEIERNSLRPEILEFGVLMEIQDAGTGISERDLKSIAQVGTGHPLRQELVTQMPALLRPTGKFGIGLQSVFLVSKVFDCVTHAKSGGAYTISFNSVAGQDDGYINVEPIEDAEAIPYGSKFQVFVPCSLKHDYRDDLRAWSGRDPYDPENRKNKPLLQAEELLSQMVLYINSLPADKLFPICVYGENGFFTDHQHNLIPGRNRVDQVVFRETTFEKGSAGLSYQDLKESLCWAFQGLDWSWAEASNTGRFCGKLEEGDRYCFDINTCRLYIWSAECHAFARFGAARFLDSAVIHGSAAKDIRQRGSGIHLFYKGIRLDITDVIDNDMELLEYVNLTDGPTEQILQLNRDKLTEEGREYLRRRVYPEIMDTARRALCRIAQDNDGLIKGADPKKVGMFEDAVMDCLFLQESDTEVEQNGDTFVKSANRTSCLISFLLLAYFAKVAARGQMPGCAVNNKKLEEERRLAEKKCMWERLLCRCDDELEMIPKYSPHWNMEQLVVKTFSEWEHMNRQMDDNQENIAHVLTNKMRYAVVSVRESIRHEWKHNLCRIKPEDVAAESAQFRNLPQLMSQSEQTVLYDRVTDHFARWMLRNIPTAECHTYLADRSDAGNTRINLLSSQASDGVYFNADMRYLLIRKICKRHQEFDANRFCTTTWTGFSCLEIENVPIEVCQVDCGFVMPACQPLMVLPMDGREMQEIYRFGDDKAGGKAILKKLKLCQLVVQEWGLWRIICNRELTELITYFDSINKDASYFTVENEPQWEIKRLSPEWSKKFQEASERYFDRHDTGDFQLELEQCLKRVRMHLEEEQLQSPIHMIKQEKGSLEACIYNYLKAYIYLNHKRDLLADAFYSAKKKHELIDRLSEDTPARQTLLDDLKKEGRSSIPPDLARRLYVEMLGMMIDSVTEIKLREDCQGYGLTIVL